ncbi:hypothetical protein B0H13DRAFT_2394701 [Mycena leptocephala]|nr:hypothetical protein B0H13DRAFT_2394701 [Mycena leptocephala]
MVKLSFAFFATFLAGLASAKSFHEMTVHRDTVMLGSDPDSDWTVAYDGNLKELGRYHTLFNNRTVELKSLPAWGAMQTDARNNWGSGSYHLYFGDDGNHGGKTVAWMCIGDDIVTVEATGDARCNTNTLQTSGTLVGTSGSVSITVTSGFTSGSTCTVTKQSTLGISYTATIIVGLPDVLGGSGSWTASAEFTNSVSKSFSTEITNEVQETIQMDAPAGSTCSLDYESKTCFESVKGRVAFTAGGWFTFGYDAATHGHYYWYMYIDDYISRGVSSYSEFTGSLNAVSKSNCNCHCT